MPVSLTTIIAPVALLSTMPPLAGEHYHVLAGRLQTPLPPRNLRSRSGNRDCPARIRPTHWSRSAAPRPDWGPATGTHGPTRRREHIRYHYQNATDVRRVDVINHTSPIFAVIALLVGVCELSLLARSRRCHRSSIADQNLADCRLYTADRRIGGSKFLIS
jgi:hypothetical protein